MRKQFWLAIEKAMAEIEGRTEARDKSMVERNQLHAWVRVYRNRRGTKRILRYAIYRNGHRVKGVKIEPRRFLARTGQL